MNLFKLGRVEWASQGYEMIIWLFCPTQVGCN